MDRFGWNLGGRITSCPRYVRHGNGRCLATAHCTFSSYGRLEAERVNQIWWNLVHACPPWCVCHDNGRCPATTHCIFSSYGRLEAECVNQFWWNLVYNSKFGQQWQSRDQILFFKIPNGGRSLLENIRYAVTRLPMDWLGRIPSCSQYWKCYNSFYTQNFIHRIEISSYIKEIIRVKLN